MKLHSLPSVTTRKRRQGRGISAGQGKTGGRGTKGQKARTGKKLRPTFEGGQTPFFQRIPKLKGFKNPSRVEYQVINVGVLNELSVSEITKEVLLSARVVRSVILPVKVLGQGDLQKKLTVQLDQASKSAIEKITKAGGTFESTAFVPRSVEKKKGDQ